MAGYGQGSYGLGSYGQGGAGAGQFSMASAVAVGTAIVRVTLSAAPLAQVQTGPGDALNPATWAVNVLNSDLSLGASLIVAAIAPVAGSADQVDVSVYGSFPPYPVQLQVAAPMLKSAAGAVIGAANSAQFYGCIAVQQSTADQVAASQRLTPTDVANPFYNPRTGGGTLLVGPSGDYQSESGVPLLRKLIVRRLLTSVGGFYHLPGYGAGLGVKQVVSLGDAVKLQARVRAQVMQEPGVADAAVSLTIQNGVVVVIQIQVETADGQSFSIGLPVGGGSMNQAA